MQKSKVKLDPYQVAKAALNLRSIYLKDNWRALDFLTQNEDVQVVTHIRRALDIEQSRVSLAVTTMARNGYLDRERKGNFISYTLNKPNIERFFKAINKFTC